MEFWRNFRRRLIRALGWIIGVFASLIAILGLIFTAYLLFFDYPEQLKAVLERELSRATGRVATIGNISVNLPNSFELLDVQIQGGEQEEPALELARMRGSVRLGELARLRLHWSELRFDGLVLRVQSGQPRTAEPSAANPPPSPVDPRENSGNIDEPDPSEPLVRSVESIPTPAVATSPEPGELSILADRVVLEDAVLEYHFRRIPLRLTAEGLDTRLVHDSGATYRGSFTYERGRLRVKEHPEIVTSVESRFTLDGRQLRVDQFDAASEIGELHASGLIQLSQRPIGQLQMSGGAELLPILHSLFGLTILDSPSGDRLTLDGALSLSEQGQRLEGQLQLARGRLAGLPIENWRSDLRWTRDRFQLIGAEGLLAGGDAELVLDQPLPSRENLATIELDFNQAELGEVLDAWASEPSHLSSSLSGTIALGLRPSDARRTVQGRFSLRGISPPRLGPSEPTQNSVVVAGASALAPRPITLRLVAEGLLEPSGVRLERLELGSAGTELTLQGPYVFETGAQWNLRLNSHDLSETDQLQRELRRLLHRPGDGREARLWGVSGRGLAAGDLRGLWTDPVFEGEFQGEGIRFQNVDWGTLDGQGQLQRGLLAIRRFEVALGDSTIRGSGDVSVGRVEASDRDFAVNATIERWPSQDAIEIFGWTGFPLEMPLSGTIVAARRDGTLSGDARLAAASGLLFGQTIDSLTARARLDDGKVLIGPVSISHGEGELGGRLAVDLSSSALEGSLTARSFELSEFPRQPAPQGAEAQASQAGPAGQVEEVRFRPSGRLDADLTLAGSLAEPEVRFEGAASDLRLGSFSLGDAEWTATVSRGLVEARFDATHGRQQQWHVQLTGPWDENRMLSGSLRFESVDLAPVLRAETESSSSLQAIVDGAGTLEIRAAAPVSLSAELELQQVLLSADNYRFVSERPASLSVNEKRVLLEPIVLTQDQSHMTIGASLDLVAETMDVQLGGATNFSIVESFYPSMVTAGDIDLSARMTGAWDRPSLTGFAELKGGSIRVRDFPQPLSDLTGRIIFDNRTARLDDIRGVFGSAPVVVSGELSMSGLSPESFDLTARGQGLRLRYPEGFLATLDAELNLVGSPESQVLGGDIEIRDAVWTREYDVVSNILSQRNQIEILEELGDSHPLANLRFDIRILAPGNLRVRNSLADIDARADLELSGTFRQPVLLGRSEAERGQIFFLGQRYDVTNGKIDFVDPTRVEPFFDLTAETRVRSYRVELRLAGTAERIEPELSSDPPLRTIDILRLLAGANERDILVGTEEEELAGVGVASILTERLSQEVGRRAERLFGLDRFSIDPFLVGQFANPTARVSLGKQISRDVSINYSVNLNAATESIVLIEYTPEGAISWLLSRDENGELGIDMRFRKSF